MMSVCVCVSEVWLRTRLGALLHCNFLLGCFSHTGVRITENLLLSLSLSLSHSLSLLSYYGSLSCFVSLSIYLSYVSFSLQIYPCIYLYIHISNYKSIFLSIYLSIILILTYHCISFEGLSYILM